MQSDKPAVRTPSLGRREFVQATTAAAVAVASGASSPAAAQDGKIEAQEHWAKKGNVDLYLYRKRSVGDATGTKPVLFLVHGSTFSCRGTYDLQVPGRQGYSMMDHFAGLGFDVWSMDHEGYGHSSRTGSHAGIMVGVEDLKAAMPVIQKETGLAKMHMYGTSSGAIRAAAFAQAKPEHVDRLILSAFTYKGDGAAEIARRRARIAELRANTRRKRDAAMIRSIFTRDGHAGTTDPAVPEAIIAMEMKFGDQIPTGTYLDMAANLPIVDPKKVLSPVLMLRGIWDGNSTDADLLDFYTQLPNGDRQFVILPETAHSPGYGKNRHLLWYAIKNFLAAPAPIAAS